MRERATRKVQSFAKLGLAFAAALLLPGCFHPMPTFDNPYDPQAQSATGHPMLDFRTITLDGERTGNEWEDSRSVIEDETGDSSYAGTGADIERVLAAADEQFLYFFVELTDDTPSTTGEFGYRVWVKDTEEPYSEKSVGNVEVGLDYDAGSWRAYAFRWDGSSWIDVPDFDASWGAAGTGIELKIDRSMVIDKDALRFRGVLQRNTLSEDPDHTPDKIFALP